MVFTFLFVVQALVAAALVGVILVQKSEGGGLGMGGSPSGLMSARGAADFLTRTTSVLAVVFVSLAIALSVLAATRSSQRVNVTATKPAPSRAALPLGGSAPPLAPPKSAAQVAAEAEAQANGKAPPPATGNGAVPIER